MKPFSIICDENKEKRVVPTKWLSKDKKTLQWPLGQSSDAIKKLIMDLKDPEDEWGSYPITTFIKFCGKFFF